MGFWDHTILSSGNSSRLSWGMSPGGLGPELPPGAPAGVHPDWGVIGLSCCLACFPMWATAVGRPRGTIWKQHDTLQCRTGIHFSGYRDRGQGTRNTKLEQRCLLALKRFPFGLLVTVGSICGWKCEVIEFWLRLVFINVLFISKDNEVDHFLLASSTYNCCHSRTRQAPGRKIMFYNVVVILNRTDWDLSDISRM